MTNAVLSHVNRPALGFALAAFGGYVVSNPGNHSLIGRLTVAVVFALLGYGVVRGLTMVAG